MTSLPLLCSYMGLAVADWHQHTCTEVPWQLAEKGSQLGAFGWAVWTLMYHVMSLLVKGREQPVCHSAGFTSASLTCTLLLMW